MSSEINIFEEKYWNKSPNFVFELFEFQKNNNPLYGEFLSLLSYRKRPKHVSEIPLLPIELFKKHLVKSGEYLEQITFLSSGTGFEGRSQHAIKSLEFYHKVSVDLFTKAFAHPADFCHLALLPSYLEQGNSSLVAMVDHFIELSNYNSSGFFLQNHSDLHDVLMECHRDNAPTILWGVSYALLDFFESLSLDFPDLIIIETGGMKGRKKEIIRSELHANFSEKTNASICSEYGMTELMSQSYFLQNKFHPSYSLSILPKEINDPLETEKFGKTARIGVVDLANIHSCAFILTQDIGIVYEDDSFDILGRLDHSDLRGCNLMISDI